MLQAIGKLAVPLPGTPVRATSKELDPAKVFLCHGVLFQALTTNTGRVYIGVTGMNKSSPGMDGVLAVLAVPTVTLLPTFSVALTISPNGLRLQDLYLDTEQPNDGVLCTVLIM